MRSVSLVLGLLALVSSASAQTRSELAPTAAPPVEDRSEWHVHADTRFVAYAVQTPRSPVALARRRLVQTAGLVQSLRLGDLRDPWTVRAVLELRLDQELGDVCERAGDERCLREQDVASRRDFQVLARLTRLDLPEGYVEVRPPRADVRVRLGRQILADAAGFLRLDGGRATASAHPLVSVDVFGGLYAQETSFAGSDGYVLQGNLRFDLPDALADERAPFVATPTRTWVIGGTASVGDARVLKVDAIAREARDEGGDLAARRVGVVARSRPHPALGLRAHGLWDPTDGTLVDAVAEVEGLTPRGLVRASARRVEPRFDLGSVWAFFDVVPTDQLSLGGQLRIGRATLAGAMHGRWTRLDETVFDAGVEVSADLRDGSRFVALGGQLWAGSAGNTARAFVDLGRRVGPVDVYARGSLWHFDHPWQQRLHGNSVAAAAGASALLTEQVRLRGELEWMHNRVAGHRVRALASLTLRVWR
ncbi:MAG: hypothetical protein H6722_08925 [Sandaracinus sp.]|nr:hypothetical protein [Sandaracinus sp.]MCB9612558.1 hypothetical protein [Sandaracinus sp.]